MLSLRLGEQKTERDVRSVNDAATWVESWLEPVVNERTTPADSVSDKHQKQDFSAKPPASVASAFNASLTLGIGPEFGIGSYETTTLGPSAFSAYRMVPHLWLGLNSGYAWRLSDTRHRSWLRVSAIAGPAWDLSPRLSFTPGLGIGFYSGRMRDPTSASGASMHMGGGFLELIARGNYSLSHHWGLSGALGARWYAFTSKGKIVTNSEDDDTEEPGHSTTATIPAEVPLLEFAAMLDVCYRFGGDS